ncbi:MAG TPA: zinc-binding dehydrogenase, partial [Bdellovibrionota bacterium]|nr:zinc-binding dehydrogenase [Bdellovibrionota bacterium]
GLGHLGVQFARAMGFYTVAVSRGPDKRKLSEELGAHQYIDAASQNIGELLGKVGGAKVILATAPNAGAISALVPGLGLDGQLLIVAAPFEPISVSAIDLIMRNGSIKGWASGSGQDSTDTMRFAKLHNLKPMIEEFPLQQAQKAYEHMMSGKVRFRSVIRMN